MHQWQPQPIDKSCTPEMHQSQPWPIDKLCTPWTWIIQHINECLEHHGTGFVFSTLQLDVTIYICISKPCVWQKGIEKNLKKSEWVSKRGSMLMNPSSKWRSWLTGICVWWNWLAQLVVFELTTQSWTICIVVFMEQLSKTLKTYRQSIWYCHAHAVVRYEALKVALLFFKTMSFACTCWSQ